MSLYEIIKKHSDGKGIGVMWKTVDTISKYIEKNREKLGDVDHLLMDLYSDMVGSHYNEEYADKKMSEMYYIGNDGIKHYTPYWTNEEMMDLYNSVSTLLPEGTNEYDFQVALNMVMSDYHNLLEEWFPDNYKAKVVDMTISWFNDPDSPHGSNIWCYMN